MSSAVFLRKMLRDRGRFQEYIANKTFKRGKVWKTRRKRHKRSVHDGAIFGDSEALEKEAGSPQV